MMEKGKQLQRSYKCDECGHIAYKREKALTVAKECIDWVFDVVVPKILAWTGE